MRAIQGFESHTCGVSSQLPNDKRKSWKIVDGKIPDDIRDLMVSIIDEHEKWKAALPDPLRPMWVEYPHLPRCSMGWRMGGGEDYRDIFYEWYQSQTHEKRHEYREIHPEPVGWEGFYDHLEKARLMRR
ncbi:hypothetical protein [Parasedimentitalea marina]|uniref:hypothetical protein n=1 Tax=Parasedimentitalea marina TaxID=2483033 RepID=UPI000FD8C78A|nr:hypothetical protein [Parasedimentitalea marina]